MQMKNHSLLRVFAVLLTLVMLIGAIPASAAAKDSAKSKKDSLNKIPETSGKWFSAQWGDIYFYVDNKNSDGDTIKQGPLYADERNDRWGSSVNRYLYNTDGELIRAYEGGNTESEYEYTDGKVSKEIRKYDGKISGIIEYEYDPKAKTESKITKDENGTVKYTYKKTEVAGTVEGKYIFPDGTEILFDKYENGKIVFGSGISFLDNKQTNTAEYSYYKNGNLKKSVSKYYNWNDNYSSLESTYVTEYNKKGLIEKTTTTYNSGSVKLSEYKYTDDKNYTITNYTDSVVTDYVICKTKTDSKNRTTTFTYKDAEGNITGKYTTIGSIATDKLVKLINQDQQGIKQTLYFDKDERVTKKTTEDSSGNMTMSQEYVFNDTKNSFKMTQIQDGVKTVLEGSYNTKKDNMKLVYKDSADKVTKTVEKKFSNLLVMREIKVDGKTTFERNSDDQIVFLLDNDPSVYNASTGQYESRDYTISKEYDPKTGRLIKSTEAYLDGSIREESEYSYSTNDKGEVITKRIRKFNNGRIEETYRDEKDREIESINYDKDGKVSFHETHNYDEKGRKIKSIHYNENGSVSYQEKFTYFGDSSTRKITEEIYNDGRKSVFKYNKNGKQIQYIAYDPDGKMTSETKAKYDKNGNRIQLTEYDANGQITSRFRFEYDEKNRQIFWKKYNSSDSLTESTEYKYYKDTEYYSKTINRDSKGYLSSIEKYLRKKDGTYYGSISYTYLNKSKKASEWEWYSKYDSQYRKIEYRTKTWSEKTKYASEEGNLRTKMTGEGKVSEDIFIPVFYTSDKGWGMSFDENDLKYFSKNKIDTVKYQVKFDKDNNLSSGKVYTVMADGTKKLYIKISRKSIKKNGTRITLKYADGRSTVWYFDANDEKTSVKKYDAKHKLIA